MQEWKEILIEDNEISIFRELKQENLKLRKIRPIFVEKTLKMQQDTEEKRVRAKGNKRRDSSHFILGLLKIIRIYCK